MKKVAIFAFNGDPMCFIHVLLNTLDMYQKGVDVRLVLEGNATGLVKKLHEAPDSVQGKLYAEIRKDGLLDGVCRACSQKMGTLESAREQGLRLLDEMSGHPSIARYMEGGYEILTF